MSLLLRFNQRGTFRIAQFTDQHLRDGQAGDERALGLMESILDIEQPDLVVLTGDVLDADKCRDPLAAWRRVGEPMRQRQIPWAAVFGNHDDENGVTRQQQMDFLQSLPLCLAQPGPPELAGVGNYLLPIAAAESHALEAVLYLLDSHNYAPKEIGGYGWLAQDQIDWYLRTSRMLRQQMGGPIPALAFFHIPLPEYETVWQTGRCTGEKNEAVCCPKHNSGFFAALKEGGDVLGTFVGHDHINDYQGELDGIRLCYGRASGFNSYGKEGFAPGARIIELRRGTRTFATWIRMEESVSKNAE